MSRATDEDIAQTVIAAGFKGDAAEDAVAIVLAESSGDPEVRNAIGYVGWWQFGSFDASRNAPVTKSNKRGVVVSVSLSCAKNPRCATGKAYIVSSQGTDWRQWSSYPAAALVYLPRAKAAIKKVSASGDKNSGGIFSDAGSVVSGAVGDAVNGLPVIGPTTALLGTVFGGLPNPLDATSVALGGIGDSISAIGSLVGTIFSVDLWKRIAMILGGTLMIAAGGFILAKER